MITALEAMKIERGRQELKTKYLEVMNRLDKLEATEDYQILIDKIESFYFGDGSIDDPELERLEDIHTDLTEPIFEDKRQVENDCIDFLIKYISPDYEKIRTGFVSLNKALKILFK